MWGNLSDSVTIHLNMASFTELACFSLVFNLFLCTFFLHVKVFCLEKYHHRVEAT